MKAISINLIMEDNENTECFVKEILPKLKERHNMKQVHYHKCEYWSK